MYLVYNKNVLGFCNKNVLGFCYLEKRKGARELTNLCCSINYDKGKEKEVEEPMVSKGGRRCQGDSSTAK